MKNHDTYQNLIKKLSEKLDADCTIEVHSFMVRILKDQKTSSKQWDWDVYQSFDNLDECLNWLIENTK